MARMAQSGNMKLPSLAFMADLLAAWGGTAALKNFDVSKILDSACCRTAFHRGLTKA